MTTMEKQLLVVAVTVRINLLISNWEKFTDVHIGKFFKNWEEQKHIKIIIFIVPCRLFSSITDPVF